MKRIAYSFLFAFFSFLVFSQNALAGDIQRTISFVVDQEADITLYENLKKKDNGYLYYAERLEVSPEKKELGKYRTDKNDNNEYMKYTYQVNVDQYGTESRYYCHVKEEGKISQAVRIKKADTFDLGDYSKFYDLTNPEELNNNDRVIYDISKDYMSYNGIYFDDGILLNANEDGSSSIRLKIGEEFQLKAYRTWQIVDGVNYYIEPDFHYEIVYGDSVSVSDKGLIKANDNGFSIIRVTYDAIKAGYIGKLEKYNAIDPVCVGIVAVIVNDAKDVTLETGISLKEYDTVYFDNHITDPTGITTNTGKTYAEYTFMPEKDSTVEVLEAPPVDQAITGNWTKTWTKYNLTPDGRVTVKLTPGKNVIKIKKNEIEEYHVIRAAGIGVRIANQTEPGKKLTVGDTARISLDGLYIPVPKMSAVYNPGLFTYTGTTSPYIQYTIDGEIFKGVGGQYSIRNDNAIYIEAETEGDYVLKNGVVNEGYMGSPLITHYNIPEEGLLRNFNAVGIPGSYDILPDIKVHFDDKQEFSDDQLNKLRYLSIKHNADGQVLMFESDVTTTTRIDTSNGLSGEDYKPCSVVSIGPSKNLDGDNVFPQFIGELYDDNVTLVLRYWTQEDEKKHIKIINGETFDVIADGFSPSYNTILFAELIVIPNDNKLEPYTYSFVMPYGSPMNIPYLKNITLLSQDHQDEYEASDAVFHSDKASYIIDGAEHELDFGEGFLVGEYNYNISVPESAEEIKMDLKWVRTVAGAESNSAKAVITVEDNDEFSLEYQGPKPDQENTIITDAIPLNEEGDTTIHVTVTSTDTLFQNVTNVYTIKVSKHGKIARRKVSFTCPTEDISVTVKNEAGKKMTPDEAGAYNLIDGPYTYTASAAGYRTLTGEFTVDTSLEGDQIVEIPALEGPRNVTFTFSTQGTELVLKDAKNKVVEPVEGVYLLIGGDTYTYYASAKGYITHKESFVVGDEEDQTIEIPALEEAAHIPKGSKVTVTIVTDEKKLISDYTVPMDLADPEMDLVTGKNYVEYNLGTYTALHALLRTLDDDQGVDYTCRKGKLNVITDMGGTYPGGSWRCEVNGCPVSDPWLYALNPGDTVLLYYDKGYEGMTHALFAKPVYEIEEGDVPVIDLFGHPTAEGTDSQALAGATIYLNGEEKGTTDASGSIRFGGLTSAGSPYVVTARKFNDAGENILTWNQCMIYVRARSGGSSDTKTVSFRLIGDKLHGDDPHNRYETWIATEEIPLDNGTDTVCDVFLKAVSSAGLTQSGAKEGYIRSITAPASLGGYALEEFDNGSASGWMYTLNGIHPQVGVQGQTVKAGDVIVFHYVDNFHIEENNYTWLEAPDVNPPGIIPYVIKSVIDGIKALPKIASLTLSDRNRVEALRKAYDSLSDEQKAEIDGATLKDLENAEARIAQLIEEEARKKTEDTQKPILKKGKAVVSGKYRYKVTKISGKKGEVSFIGCKNKKITRVTIPATVKYQGYTLKVTAVGPKALKSYKKLKSLAVGKNVKTIGKSAFVGCVKLKKITVQSLVLKKVGAGSLKGIYKKAVIKVPSRKLKAYKKLFRNKGQAKTVKIRK